MLTLAVPIYNKEPYLPRFLDSLLAQTCRDFEVLLIDDGSTDGSGRLCDAMAAQHPDLIRVIHKENGGLSEARNTGIDAARGTWITFPDPDDWVEPDYVQRFLELQEAHRADLVCTGYWVDIGTYRRIGYRHVPTVTMTAREARRALLAPTKMAGFAWNKIYSLELLRRNGLRFSSDVGTAEDLEFTYRYLGLIDRICFCPTVQTYHYDQHPESATNSGFSRKSLQIFRVYELMAADEDPDMAQAARAHSCIIAVNHLWSLLQSGEKDPQSRKLLLSYIRRNLWPHLASPVYSRTRKLQALAAAVSPRLFALLKRGARSRSH